MLFDSYVPENYYQDKESVKTVAYEDGLSSLTSSKCCRYNNHQQFEIIPLNKYYKQDKNIMIHYTSILSEMSTTEQFAVKNPVGAYTESIAND